LKFVAGNAENIPFDNESFDVVLNVESCHTYGSVPKFLSEVYRVLRPGGYFLCTDFRTPQRMKILIQQLSESGMEIISQKDISSNVEKAIEDEDIQKRERIKRVLPRWVVPVFVEFAGVTGSAMDKGLRAGELVYYMWVLQKN
jgi:ubiquinone/menaquinone biosynthesis C-methylase UbiE